MAITVKQPIGSMLYYIVGSKIIAGILCGWEEYGYTCIFFQTAPVRQMMTDPNQGRPLASYFCDIVPADRLHLTADDAINEALHEQRRVLEESKMEAQEGEFTPPPEQGTKRKRMSYPTKRRPKTICVDGKTETFANALDMFKDYGIRKYYDVFAHLAQRFGRDKIVETEAKFLKEVFAKEFNATLTSYTAYNYDGERKKIVLVTEPEKTPQTEEENA